MNCQISTLANFFNGTQVCNMGDYNARNASCATGSQVNNNNHACNSGSYVEVINEPHYNHCKPKRVRVICTECC